ncbi:MAG TPA: hypothetical protein VL099_12860 [Candidatus Binatia bacterium]|nr:hypothetical protein [Candidatus Binatia bacterium]
MESLENYQQTRRVVEDFTARTLAAIPSEFGKLLYVASLCDLSSGRYQHDGLAARFPAEAVQQALGFCHQELFLRLLEMPLEQQEWDLRTCLASMEGDYSTKLRRLRETEFYRSVMPVDSPVYLRELYVSNVRTLLDLLLEERAIPGPGTSPGPPPGR